MAKKKDNQKRSSKKERPFNNPFDELKDIKDDLAKKQGKQKRVTGEKKPEPKRVRHKAANEDELFLKEMGGTTPLDDKKSRVFKKKKSDYEPGTRRKAEDAQAFAELEAMVRGEMEFDISPSEEYIEIKHRDLSNQIFNKLKKGEYSRQAWLNIHHKTRDEAREEVENFLFDCRVRGLQCVGIIPGKGSHSPGGRAVLKPALVSWLQRGRLKHIVMGFVSALPNDGGLGAVYVLLRKH